MSAIQVRNLVKTFHENGKTVTAVNGISFEVKKGEIFGLLGPNGAGKTTTINILAGLMRHDSGEITILGKDPKHNHEYIRKNSNVATAYSWLSDVLTIRQNLTVYAKIYGVKNYQKRIEELLDLFELQTIAERRVIRLSSGENTRAILCKGLLNHPQVLFLDECTVGLDPDIADKTRKLIKQYQQAHHCSILFTSHYMKEVEELCDRIGFMVNGNIVRIDTSSNLKKLIDSHTVEIGSHDHVRELTQFLTKMGLQVRQLENQRISFCAPTQHDQVYKIIAKIYGKKFLINHLTIKEPTLDDIFIKLARKQ